MRLAVLTLAVLACGSDPITPPPLGEFQVVVQGYPHDWSSYTCLVTVHMEDAGQLVATDSVAVAAGLQDTVTFSLPARAYTVRTVLRWRGTPSTWELRGGPVEEKLAVNVPGNHRIDCP